MADEKRRWYPNLGGKVHEDVHRAIRILFDNQYDLRDSMKAQSSPSGHPLAKVGGDLILASPSSNTVKVLGLMGYKISGKTPTDGQQLTFVKKSQQIEWT